MKRLAILVTLLALAQPSLAQQPIVQSGPVTPGHPLMVITNGVAGDGGPVTGPYNQLCLSTTQTGGGALALNNFGGATGGLSIMLNGVQQPFTVPTFVSPPHQFVNAFSAGNFSAAQPTFNDILGLGSMAQQNANTVAITGGSITGLPAPTSNTDAATKQYVDINATGQHFHLPVVLATAGAPLPTYTWSATGGGTLTGTANGNLSIDGIATTINSRILVKDELNSGNACNGNVNAACDGVYTVSVVGDALNPYKIVRSSALNSQGNAENTAAGWTGGDNVPVSGGNLNTNSVWVNTAGIVTINLTPFSFFVASTGVNQPWLISGSSIYYAAGFVGVGIVPTTKFQVDSGTLFQSGGISSATWGTSGIRFKQQTAQTFTDTSAGGTVAAAYTNILSGGAIAASNSRTFTKYYNLWVDTPTAGANTSFGHAISLGTQGDVEFNGNLALSGNVTAGTWQGTPIANAFIANPQTTVNGTTCTLGASCAPPGPPVAGGRLVAASPDCSSAPNVQLANVPSAPVVCYVPYLNGTGNQIWVNGANLTFSTQTLTLDSTHHLVGNLYDVFEIAGPNICAGGNPWSSIVTSPARTDGISQLSNGLFVNTGTISHCWNNAVDLGPVSANAGTYLGSCYMIANGATVWTPTPAPANGGPTGGAVLGCFNAYNQVLTHAFMGDKTLAYTFIGTNQWQNFGSSTNERISYVDGLGTLQGTSQAEFYFKSDWTGDQAGVNGGGTSLCIDGVGNSPSAPTCQNGGPGTNFAQTSTSWSTDSQIAVPGLSQNTNIAISQHWLVMAGFHFAQALWVSQPSQKQLVGSGNNACCIQMQLKVPM